MTSKPNVDAVILDGAALAHMLKPGGCNPFADYSNKVFCPYVSSTMNGVSRTDIVWDRYSNESLKADTRSRRGTGKRRRVEPATKLPQNWSDFLKRDENKEELFLFLSKECVKVKTPGQIISTIGSEVLLKDAGDMSNLTPCNHEEADTPRFVHLYDCVMQGYRKLLIRTVDTDVVVLAISVFGRVDMLELWVAYGVGKHFRYLAAHDIARALGPNKSLALPFFMHSQDVLLFRSFTAK